MCISNYVVVVVVVAVVAVAAVVVVAVVVAVVVIVVAVVAAVAAAAVVVAVVRKVPRCKSTLAKWMRKDQIPMREDSKMNGKPWDSDEKRLENLW